jgi:hypothetical protein
MVKPRGGETREVLLFLLFLFFGKKNEKVQTAFAFSV